MGTAVYISHAFVSTDGTYWRHLEPYYQAVIWGRERFHRNYIQVCTLQYRFVSH